MEELSLRRAIIKYDFCFNCHTKLFVRIKSKLLINYCSDQSLSELEICAISLGSVSIFISLISTLIGSSVDASNLLCADVHQ